jgi:hypothetical protein
MKNFFLPFIITAISFLLFSCIAETDGTTKDKQASTATDDANALKRVALDLTPFSAIKLDNNADVILKKGDTQSVEVEGPEKLIDLLNKKIKVDSWNIKYNSRVLNPEKIVIYITLPSFYALHINGSGNITGKSNFTDIEKLVLLLGGSGNLSLSGECEALDCKLMGSGNMSLAFTAEEASCDITGSGDLDIQGKANTFEVSISGSGDVEGADFKVKTAEIRTFGSGNCSIKVSDQLFTKIVGSGDIIYYGNPKVKSTNTGSGVVEKG